MNQTLLHVQTLNPKARPPNMICKEGSFLLGAAVSSLEVEQGIADSRLRGGGLRMRGRGGSALLPTGTSTHSVKNSRQTRVRRLSAYIAIAPSIGE
jgi:hypothetical protein